PRGLPRQELACPCQKRPQQCRTATRVFQRECRGCQRTTFRGRRASRRNPALCVGSDETRERGRPREGALEIALTVTVERPPRRRRPPTGSITGGRSLRRTPADVGEHAGRCHTDGCECARQEETHLSPSSLQGRDERGHHVEEVAYDTVVGHFEDGRVGIF